MSFEYLLALPSLPAKDRFAPYLADLGGVDGDWTSEIRVASVRAGVLLAPGAETLKIIADGLKRGRAPKRLLSKVVTMTGGFDDVLAVAAAMMGIAGGALLSEDGELIEHRGKAAEPPRTILPPPAVDVRIPAEVADAFQAHQIPYALAARCSPTVTFGALVNALTPKPERVGQSRYGAHWEANLLGELMIKQFSGPDRDYYEKELRAIGLPRPDSIFRLGFEHWHVKHVSEANWLAGLQLVCALARNTNGILYRPRPACMYDFAPGA